MDNAVRHAIPVRVYYEDTDVGGVVYYANYFHYMERGRTELLRSRGVELAAYHDQGLMFAVIETAAKYRASARYNDLLSVETVVTEIASVILSFDCAISNQNGLLLVTGATRLACVDAKSGKACRIPQTIRCALKTVSGVPGTV